MLILRCKPIREDSEYIHVRNRIDADNDGSIVSDPWCARFYGSHLTDFGDLLCISLLILFAVPFVSCDSLYEGKLLCLTRHL